MDDSFGDGMSFTTSCSCVDEEWTMDGMYGFSLMGVEVGHAREYRKNKQKVNVYRILQKIEI
jgi:hypothetical protein